MTEFITFKPQYFFCDFIENKRSKNILLILLLLISSRLKLFCCLMERRTKRSHLQNLCCVVNKGIQFGTATSLELDQSCHSYGINRISSGSQQMSWSHTGEIQAVAQTDSSAVVIQSHDADTKKHKTESIVKIPSTCIMMQ